MKWQKLLLLIGRAMYQLILGEKYEGEIIDLIELCN